MVEILFLFYSFILLYHSDAFIISKQSFFSVSLDSFIDTVKRNKLLQFLVSPSKTVYNNSLFLITTIHYDSSNVGIIFMTISIYNPPPVCVIQKLPNEQTYISATCVIEFQDWAYSWFPFHLPFSLYVWQVGTALELSWEGEIEEKKEVLCCCCEQAIDVV